MSWRLFGAKPLSEPMLVCCQLDPWELIAVDLHKNTIIYIEENYFEKVVCTLTATLSRVLVLDVPRDFAGSLWLFWSANVQSKAIYFKIRLMKNHVHHHSQRFSPAGTFMVKFASHIYMIVLWRPMCVMRLQSTENWLFVQQLIQATIKSIPGGGFPSQRANIA